MVGPTFYSKNMQYNSLYTQISNEPQRGICSDVSLFHSYQETCNDSGTQ